jgi:hypothetical protein
MNELAPYPSPEERDAELSRSIAAAGGELRVFGHSVEGRPLLAARVPQAGAGDRPAARVLVAANIHGLEYVSSRVALGFLAAVPEVEPLRRLRERAELWVVPCLNPDGYARVWACGGHGRVAELRPNARGVDLNRNFPLPPGRRRLPLPGAGSDFPGDPTYVGPAPLSEPETVALAALLGEARFRAATSGHCFMGSLIPAHVEDAAAFTTYRELCAAFTRAQRGTRYRRLAIRSRVLDTFTGELEDYHHHQHGTWAICVETFTLWASWRQHVLAPSPFWRFNPRQPDPWVANDVAGIAAFLHAALSL